MGQRLKQNLLLGRQRIRNHHLGHYHLVASPVAPQEGHTLVPQTEGSAVLNASINPHRIHPFEGGYLHISTKRGLGYIDGQFEDDIVVLAAEEFVGQPQPK